MVSSRNNIVEAILSVVIVIDWTRTSSNPIGHPVGTPPSRFAQ